MTRQLPVPRRRRRPDRVAARHAKKALLTLLVVGALGSVTVQRTYALFSTEEQNAGGTLASGTITLNATVGVRSPCYSYQGSGNVQPTCDPLFTDTSGTENYPGEPRSVGVEITNGGSIAAGDLGLYSPGACTAVNTTSYTGTPHAGDPCAAGGLQIHVEETDSGGTATRCWYPLGVATAACGSNWGDLASFRSAYSSGSGGLHFAAGPAAQQSRYFRVSLQVPSTADNSYQARGAQFALAFHMTS